MTTELNESSLIEEAFVLNLRRPLEVDGALQWSGIIRIVVKTANGFSTVDADVTVPAGADASFGHLFEAMRSAAIANISAASAFLERSPLEPYRELRS